MDQESGIHRTIMKIIKTMDSKKLCKIAVIQPDITRISLGKYTFFTMLGFPKIALSPKFVAFTKKPTLLNQAKGTIGSIQPGFS